MGELQAELIEPEDGRWRRLLERAAHDVYHLPEYATLCARACSGEAFGLHAVTDGAELLVPLIVKRVPQHGDASLDECRDAASPYGYASPVLRGNVDECEWPAFAECVKETLANQKILSCFLRGHPFMPRPAALFDQLGNSVSSPTVVIDLEADDDAIWRAIRNDHRDRIKRMRRRGYSIAIDDWSHFTGFKALYAETMRNVGASSAYFFEDVYFEDLRSKLAGQLHLFSVLAPDGGLASSALVTAFNGMVHGHLLGSALQYRKDSPSILVYDAVWRWAKERGDRFVNVGGGRGGAEDSLFEFKRGFSGITRTVWTTRVICSPALYRAACRSAGVDHDATRGFFPAYRAVAPIAGPALERPFQRVG